jgi:nucleoside 2-deoxyribosyltransferase
MTNNLIYLSGPIAGLTYTEGADWREYATRCFPPHIQGVSPLRGHRMLEGLGPIKNLMIDHPFRKDTAINRRDKFDTLRATVVLVNLLGTTKVSIGTVMEVAWAFDHGIPVILAIEPEGNPHDHPMVRDCTSVRVASLDEAIEAAVAFVAPHESLAWTRIEQVHMLMESGQLDLRQPALKENTSGSTLTQ